MPEGPHSFERNKDRLSYTHQIVKVDLTQVKVSDVSLIICFFAYEGTFEVKKNKYIYRYRQEREVHKI